MKKPSCSSSISYRLLLLQERIEKKGHATYKAQELSPIASALLLSTEDVQEPNTEILVILELSTTKDKAKTHTLLTHCPSRSTSVGVQAPAARTTLSAYHFVPSAHSTPIHVFPDCDSIGFENVPDLTESNAWTKFHREYANISLLA